MSELLLLREIEHGAPAYQATVALREAVLRAPLGLRFAAGELAGERGSRHLAAYRGGELAGCLVLQPLEDGAIRMRQVAVAPGCRNQGIGSALVSHSERLAQQLGFCRMVLHARDTAVGFYLRLGYRPVGEPFEEVTLPHQAMEKALG